MATLADRKKEFRDKSRKLAFSCIDAKVVDTSVADTRQNFLKLLEDRSKDPSLISQSSSNLCGPAAFMYCIAREKPDDYQMYVLDLALTGKGRLGNLQAAPEGCLNVDVGKDANQLIEPVDWVALAGLRDSPISRMDSVGTEWGGMTPGVTLARWFRNTGWFRDVRNTSSLIPSKPNPLDDLLQLNTLPASYVCLLLNSRVLTGKPTPWNGATHWVVLGDGSTPGGGTNGMGGTQIRIQTQCKVAMDPFNRVVMTCPKSETPHPIGSEYITPAFFDQPIIDDKRLQRRRELEQGIVDFKMYTWKTKNWAIDTRSPGRLTVEEFLKHYFGFVSARLA